MADIKVLPQVSAFLAQEHGQFIDGQLIPAAGGQRLPVVNPANGQTIASVAGATADEVEQAMQSADRALKGEWGKSLPAQRQQILLRFADLLEAHREEIAQLETLTNGKLIGSSRLFEVDHTAFSSGITPVGPPNCMVKPSRRQSLRLTASDIPR